MTSVGWLQILLLAGLVILSVRPLGGYMVRVFAGERTPLQPLLGPIERGLYRLSGINPAAEQRWLAYALSLLAFHLVGIAGLYGLLRLQQLLPLDPQGLGPMTPGPALNTAITFATNASWQSYAGEGTLGYLAQMLGITVQSFLSAASGIAVAMALIRGFA